MTPTDESVDSRSLAEALRAETGIDVVVKEEVRAITASVDGEVLRALVVSAPATFFVAYFKKLAEELATRTPAAAARIFQRRQVIADSGERRVVIDPDAPREAILLLLEPLPEAPSGELRYSRTLGQWVDSDDPSADGNEQ